MLTRTEKFALDHFLSDYPQYNDDDENTFHFILELIQDEDEVIDIWAPFADYPRDWIVGEIIKMERNLMELLK